MLSSVVLSFSNLKWISFKEFLFIVKVERLFFRKVYVLYVFCLLHVMPRHVIMFPSCSDLRSTLRWHDDAVFVRGWVHRDSSVYTQLLFSVSMMFYLQQREIPVQSDSVHDMLISCNLRELDTFVYENWCFVIYSNSQRFQTRPNI